MKKNIIFLIGLILFPSLAFAQESVLQSFPIGSQASDISSPSSQLFNKPVDEPKIKKPDSDLPAFIHDTKLKLNLRTMYLDKNNFSAASNQSSEQSSSAVGGAIALKTGKLAETFDLGAEVFTSQKIYGPLDKDGALVLEEGQDSYSVLGVLNPRFEHQGHLLSFYRQRHDLPYLNSQDSRMTPNTFESYDYAFLGQQHNAPIRFGGGYFDRIKTRNQDQFIHMSEAAGIVGKERGMPWLGVIASPTKEVNLAAINYMLLDTVNIFYSDADFKSRLSDSLDLKISLQYSNQSSIGSELLDAQSDSTEMMGSQFALSYRNVVLRSAVTMNSSSGNLISPFGAYPGYNAALIDDFKRAGEIAWKLGLSYDLAGINLKGVSAFVDFIQGNNAVDQAKQDLTDQREVDINIDFRPEVGFLNGFWLRLRCGFVDFENAGSGNDFRLILNYGSPVI